MASTCRDTECDVLVVGGGPAGQMAAIRAAEAGQKVLLLEQMHRLGLKLLASGGGRANLTRMVGQGEIEAAFGRQGRFLGPALSVMGPAELRSFLRRLEVETVVDDHGRVYPASQQAAEVQAALTRRLEQLGVSIRLSCVVKRLWIEQGCLRGVETSSERRSASRVVLACGGASWPKLGGTGGGYVLARQAGHTLIEPVPALVPLVTQETWPTKLAGVAVSGARVWINLAKQPKAGIVGDLLFTHRGLSGPAMINLSGQLAQLLQHHKQVPIRIELLAGMTRDHWEREIESWRCAVGKRRVAGLLREKIPGSLARTLCQLSGLSDDLTAAQLSAVGRKKLAELLGAMELTIIDTEGFGSAFVTRGGVKLKEVNPQTLESRLLSGLYLVGEMLDLDGPTGGYNLQWAFASGWLAGQGA